MEPIQVADRLDEVLADFSSLIRPYATGNLHPLFMGWVHGAGTPVGMIAEMLAAGLNANCGGRNHIAGVSGNFEREPQRIKLLHHGERYAREERIAKVFPRLLFATHTLVDSTRPPQQG